ncbi:phage shock protein operon transcriptional activator [Desulfocurvus sp. DL9XJH121]
MPNDESASSMEFLGQSDAFLEFMERLSAVAAVDRPVLLVGERGTGKELAAGRLHYLSPRWQGPLAALNCSALAPSLLESELFGHEAGAFTGAGARRAGRFETADGGTLFLDEIATMPPTAQEKILRVVEYGEFERVGGARPVRVDVRVVGATNADLPALAEAGRFKRDLLDRLSFEVLTLPPLRCRSGDAELLARHFAARMAVELGQDEAPRLSGEVVRTLTEHPWPGNVRELKNAVERSMYRAPGAVLRELVLDPFDSPWRPRESEARRDAVKPQAPARPGAGRPVHLKDAVLLLERDMLRNALTAARHNQKKAAGILGLTYHQFRGLYRKHQGERDD